MALYKYEAGDEVGDGLDVTAQSPDQIKSVIMKYMIKWFKGGHITKMPMIWGEAGVGKSSTINQLADEIEEIFNKNFQQSPKFRNQLNLEQPIKVIVTEVSMASLNPMDAMGVPVIEDDPNAERKVFKWAQSQDLTLDPSNYTINILFVDEVNRASRDMRAIVMRMLHDKKLGSMQLPKNTFIVGAGNLVDMNSIFGEDAPKDRTLPMYMTGNDATTESYAKQQYKDNEGNVIEGETNWHPIVLEFYQNHKKELTEEKARRAEAKDSHVPLTLRTLTHLSEVLRYTDPTEWNSDDNDFVQQVEHHLGKSGGLAEEFIGFASLRANIPDVAAIVNTGEVKGYGGAEFDPNKMDQTISYYVIKSIVNRIMRVTDQQKLTNACKFVRDNIREEYRSFFAQTVSENATPQTLNALYSIAEYTEMLDDTDPAKLRARMQQERQNQKENNTQPTQDDLDVDDSDFGFDKKSSNKKRKVQASKKQEVDIKEQLKNIFNNKSTKRLP
jgi:MoxR-like ATPase